MKKTISAVFIILITTWFIVCLHETKWIFSVIGYTFTDQNISPEDRIFILSSQPAISKNQFQLVANSVCEEINKTCYSNNLSLANALSISGLDFLAAKNVLEAMNSLTNRAGEVCNAKLHLSYLIYEINSKVMTAAHNRADIARKILSDLKTSESKIPDLDYECQDYFYSHPHIAKEYIHQVTILYAYSDQYYYAPWLFLLMAAEFVD